MEEKEIWKDVVGYEGLYEVSDFGNVRSVKRFVECYHNRSKCMKLSKVGGKVLKGTIDKYKSTEGWKEFVNIKEETSTGIDQVAIDEPQILRRYTINGNKATTPKNGINIIQMDNGEVKKVIVK